MIKSKTQKIALAGILSAIGVVGSLFSVPILASRSAPVQHMINILCAILLGPSYGVGVAFVTSFLRNIFGLGTLLAFPGSIFGALLCGLVYQKTGHTYLTYLAEVVGTTFFGGLAAYPIAILFMGQAVGDMAFYAFLIPFFFSTLLGAILAAIVIESLKRTKTIHF